MRTTLCLALTASMCAVGGRLAAQTAKIYPGATLDAKVSAEATAAAAGSGIQAKIYTTPDGFDKVSAFYTRLYHPTTSCASPPSGAGMPKIEVACYTLDGAKDLASSKEWLKVQWPYIGNKPGSLMPDLSDVRQETVITLVWKS